MDEARLAEIRERRDSLRQIARNRRTIDSGVLMLAYAQDVPDLLAAVDALRADNVKLREALIDVGGTDAAGDNPCWCNGGPEHTPECRQASAALEAARD